MLVSDVEDVLRFRAHAISKGALEGDLVKHVASTSVSVYLHEPAEGIGVESPTATPRSQTRATPAGC